LSLFGIGEASDGVTVEDGFTVWSLGEYESGWAVTDCGNGLGVSITYE
jgi:hypothetical protein